MFPSHLGGVIPLSPRAIGKRVATALGAACALTVALTACSPDVSVPLDTAPQVDAPFDEALTAQLQDAATHAMAAAGAPGAVVGVWAPWSGSWVTALGVQDPATGEAIDPDAAFRVGQLTRPMTCDVLYAVADEGRVALDAKVSEHVPGAADVGEVTLEQLCDGTSGIGGYAGQLSGQWTNNPERRWDPRELAAYGLGQPRTGEPGAAYRGSDAGYVLLGLALERITGQSAASLIEQYVADPLDLTGTQLPPAGQKEPSDGAVLEGHIPVNGPDGALNCAQPQPFSVLSSSAGYTDAGAVSNVEDLHRYVQALAIGALTPDDTDRFADAKPVYDGAPSWFTTAGGALLAGSLVGQSGSVPGYATAAFSDPNSGLTVVVALNSSATGANIAQSLAWELAAIASKAPATGGDAAPEAGLPWTADQFRQAIAEAAVCPVP